MLVWDNKTMSKYYMITRTPTKEKDDSVDKEPIYEGTATKKPCYYNYDEGTSILGIPPYQALGYVGVNGTKIHEFGSIYNSRIMVRRATLENQNLNGFQTQNMAGSTGDHQVLSKEQTFSLTNMGSNNEVSFGCTGVKNDQPSGYDVLLSQEGTGKMKISTGLEGDDFGELGANHGQYYEFGDL